MRPVRPKISHAPRALRYLRVQRAPRERYRILLATRVSPRGFFFFVAWTAQAERRRLTLGAPLRLCFGEFGPTFLLACMDCSGKERLGLHRAIASADLQYLDSAITHHATAASKITHHASLPPSANEQDHARPKPKTCLNDESRRFIPAGLILYTIVTSSRAQLNSLPTILYDPITGHDA